MRVPNSADRLDCPWLESRDAEWRNMPQCPRQKLKDGLPAVVARAWPCADSLVLLGLDNGNRRLVPAHRNQIEEILDLAADFVRVRSRLDAASTHTCDLPERG